MRPRHGSVLLIALIVVLLLIVGLFVVQRMSVENARMARSLFLFEDALQRADGLVELLISRYKRELRYSSVGPLTTPASGSESGIWEGRRYDLGWEREEPKPSATRWRTWVWIWFPDDRPRPTFRFELELRFAAPLAPRVLIVNRVAQDTVEPANAASRQAAKAQLSKEAPDRLRAAAKAEAWSDRMEPPLAGETPAAFAARAGVGPTPAEVGRTVDALTALAAVDDATVAAARVNAARAFVAAAKDLPRRWQDGAAYELAGALINDAEFAPAAQARATRQEALKLLDDALARPAAGCGDAKLAWRAASLRLRLRANNGDPAELAAVREASVRMLLARGGGFFHRRADIEVKELAPYLEQLWQARVAASVQVSNSQFLVMSIREDGSMPLIHAEAAAPIEPLAFTNDGGAIVAMGHARMDPNEWKTGGIGTTHWRLPLEGLEPIDMEPSNGFYPDPKDPHLRYYSSAFVSPDDRVTVTNYSVLDETEDPQMYPLGIPNAWFVQERTSVQFRGRMDSGPYAESFVLSPRGDEVLGLFHNARRQMGAGLRKMSTSRIAQAAYTGTVRADVEGAPRGDERPPVFITLPDRLETGGAGVGLSWETVAGADWAAMTILEPAGTKVHFWKTSGLAENAQPTEQLSARLPFDPNVAVRHPYYARMGKLVRNPPGYLVGIDDTLWLVPLPGTSTAAPKPWPVGLAGRIDSVGDVCSPPWGDVAFMSLQLGTGGTLPHSLIKLDLHTGQAETLLGPGGKVKAVKEAWRVAVSPVPVSRTAPIAPIPD